MKEIQNINHLYDEVREIIASARQNAVRSVDFSRVQMYWQIGRRIQEEEQKGKERADYGAYLLKNLAKKLEPEYGSGFSYRQLNFCRQFYRMYPIANALRSQFNWTQYRLLIAISDDCKREYYELETMNVPPPIIHVESSSSRFGNTSKAGRSRFVQYAEIWSKSNNKQKTKEYEEKTFNLSSPCPDNGKLQQ